MALEENKQVHLEIPRYFLTADRNTRLNLQGREKLNNIINNKNGTLQMNCFLSGHRTPVRGGHYGGEHGSRGEKSIGRTWQNEYFSKIRIKIIWYGGLTRMDENTQAKFDAKLKELLATARKKKNVLEYQEISDFFKDIDRKSVV